ncbi:MAG: ZIP family metal transporter [Sandaracinaceae bacterium]
MLVTLIVIGIVSLALIGGAAWAAFGRLPPRVEGFAIAVAGGALVESLILELIEPAVREAGLTVPMLAVVLGAVVFAGLDYAIDERWGGESGGGLLAAITLDGVPENLALGVALVGAGPTEVAALAGSIFLSNLPEAAGGAKEMMKSGWGKAKVLGIWTAAAAALALAAIVGNLAFEGAPREVLAATRSFAAGAVIASLATEVFPKAFQKDHHWAGVATVLGLVLAYLLGSLGEA